MELIIGQCRYFGASLLYGLGLMFCYDFLRVFRGIVRHGKFSIVLEDWLFWIVAAFLVFQMVFAMNYGMLRFFFVGSLIVGMWLYRKLVGDHFLRGMSALVSWLFRPYVWLHEKLVKTKKTKGDF